MTEVYHICCKDVKQCGGREGSWNIYYNMCSGNMCSGVDRLQEFGFAHGVLVAEALFGGHFVEAVYGSLID